MTIIIIILSLIFIGILSSLSGQIIEKIKLPSLIGMMISGMILGPSFLNIIPKEVINISPAIKDIALVTVLFIGGLGISLNQMKEIGRPAILLSIIPATLEGITIALLSRYFLNFTFIQGAILGFIIAAVSPAVLVPSMISLINRKLGENKSIPQMLLVGASADDTIAITLFTTFLGVYLQGINGKNISIVKQLSFIPITIILSILIGWILAKLTSYIFKNISKSFIKVLIAYFICIIMRVIEQNFKIEIFNSLLTIMIYGFFLRNYVEEISKEILNIMNKIWAIGKIYLFTFVGMAINPKLVGNFFIIGVIMLIFSLSIRSLGVLISLIGTNLNKKEKLFCIIAYLPKATVQSAKAGIPLQMGVLGGDVMQAIAILSVLITAPIGAIGIKLTAEKYLEKAK
ncbi:cation:proton antiporter domain-containing protein [Clostridium septicum]|uniref:Cation:proton antiporter n=1 Tax=Clostridium septicum TaxID=1504 RepID=A0A9N7JN54_CLOSE|nr:cation:proton antiporter [Clostridium septicum]AYE35523.1 toxin PIN [Clostridium septicum]MDU1314573.1 cation:proton antiporter [Clostridium septicum]QAS60909.1 toxin PIN [Clostridium septicum]UEC19818.1 cation:proton antiporter [Clostridium septicum]USS02122.1 cation:proton antiporter [Clostridium septicum]